MGQILRYTAGQLVSNHLTTDTEYGIGLSPNEPNPENAVRNLVSFLPMLDYGGANMTKIDARGILDIAMAGT
jgi:hypothetical protein